MKVAAVSKGIVSVLKSFEGKSQYSNETKNMATHTPHKEQ